MKKLTAYSVQLAGDENGTRRISLSATSYKLQAGSRGMTLIETLVWIVVLICAMIALSVALLSFYRTNRYAIENSTAIQSAQHGMDKAVRDLRTASYSNVGAYPIISIAANQISFYANVTAGDANFQQVRLFAQGNSFKEGIIEPAGDPPMYTGTEVVNTLSDYVQNITLATSTFYYYDQNGALITDYSKFQNVRFVTINLVVDSNTNSNPGQLTLTSSAALRNLITH